MVQALKTLSPTGFYTPLSTALSTWRDNTHTPITEYKSIAKTPSVPPKYCDHDDDGDVSEGALPDVCVPLRISRCEALQHNQVHFITSAREAYTYEQWMRGTHTDMQVTYSMKQIPVPKLTPLSAPICVYMSSPDTWQLTQGGKKRISLVSFILVLVQILLPHLLHVLRRMLFCCEIGRAHV